MELFWFYNGDAQFLKKFLNMANKQFYHNSYIYISVYLCNWLENHIMIHFISRTKQFFCVSTQGA